MKKRMFFIFIYIFFFQVKVSYADIYWYIGVAFTKPANEIANKYINDKVIVIADGSNNLMQKIIFSKKGDLFLPGAKIYEKILRKKNLVIKSLDFIKQVPVFGVSKNSSNKINTFYDLLKKNIRIALGNSSTMALGKIYKKIEVRMPHKIKKHLKNNCKIKGINVAQIVNYLKMNIVDAGILFESVAKIQKIKTISIPCKYNIIDTAPLLILKFSQNIKKTEKFFIFILNNKKIFEKYGYETL